MAAESPFYQVEVVPDPKSQDYAVNIGLRMSSTFPDPHNR